MDLLKKVVLAVCTLFSFGCQMGYLFKSAYNQVALLNARVPIEKALQDPSLTADEKAKLELTLNVRKFAAQELGLNVDKNYSTYVKLDRPFVSYAISASPKWRLETYRWSFPIVGKVPYKAYFKEADALEEEADLKKLGLDTYVRGVTAYSTLGWFNDPLLSSMLRGKEAYLVNTIIHESVHATLFIKSEADFNERLATFLGNKGMEIYYRKLEGVDSATLKSVVQDSADDQVFSKFITTEIKELEQWYLQLPKEQQTEEVRQQRISQIQKNFISQVLPKLKSRSMEGFAKAQLNNARLVVYKTYMQDLKDFEKLYELVGNNFVEFMKVCRSLERHKNPSEGLKELIALHSAR